MLEILLVQHLEFVTLDQLLWDRRQSQGYQELVVLETLHLIEKDVLQRVPFFLIETGGDLRCFRCSPPSLDSLLDVAPPLPVLRGRLHLGRHLGLTETGETFC